MNSVVGLVDAGVRCPKRMAIDFSIDFKKLLGEVENYVTVNFGFFSACLINWK